MARDPHPWPDIANSIPPLAIRALSGALGRLWTPPAFHFPQHNPYIEFIAQLAFLRCGQKRRGARICSALFAAAIARRAAIGMCHIGTGPDGDSMISNAIEEVGFDRALYRPDRDVQL